MAADAEEVVMVNERRALAPEVVPLDAVSLARNLVGWVFILATCIFLGPPVVLIMALLYPFGLAHRWGDFTVLWWLAVLRWLWRVELIVDGLEHIERGRTYVICCNHRSHLDAVSCLLGFKDHLRFGFLMKRSLSLIPMWGWFIWMNGYVPIDRGRSRKSRDQLATGVKYLRRGRSVMVFPEGTRAPGHAFLPFKKGAVILAVRAQVSLLPVVVSGTAALWPKGSLFVRPGKVRVEVRPPVETEGKTLDDRDALLGAVREAIVSRYRLAPDAPPLEEERALFEALAPARRVESRVEAEAAV